MKEEEKNCDTLPLKQDCLSAELKCRAIFADRLAGERRHHPATSKDNLKVKCYTPCFVGTCLYV